MKMDETLYGITDKIKNFGAVYLVDISKVPDFNKMLVFPPPPLPRIPLSFCMSYIHFSRSTSRPVGPSEYAPTQYTRTHTHTLTYTHARMHTHTHTLSLNRLPAVCMSFASLTQARNLLSRLSMHRPIRPFAHLLSAAPSPHWMQVRAVRPLHYYVLLPEQAHDD